MDEVVLTVSGMDCRACEERVERAVAKLAGVRRVSADRAVGQVKVVVESASSEAAVRAGITAAGFEVA